MKLQLLISALALLAGLPSSAPAQTEARAPARQTADGRDVRRTTTFTFDGTCARTDVVAAGVVDAGEELLGRVADYVLESRTGELTHAVVQTASGTRRLVAFDALAWQPEAARFVIPADELENAPELDPETLRTLEREAGSAAEGSLPAPSADGMPMRRLPRYALASELVRQRVLSGGLGIGSVAALVLLPERGIVPFVAVSPPTAPLVPSDPYVMPWEALSRTEEDDLTIAPIDLERAPVLPHGEAAVLEETAFRHAVYRFYGVQPRPLEAPLRRSATGEASLD